jgi:DNA-binding CsgD family transcriptional regulator
MLRAMECESTRGEWGGRCPDCGQTLPPKPGPLKSWMSQQDTGNDWSFGSRSGGATTTDSMGRAYGSKPGRPKGIVTDRQREIARIVAKHDGNMTKAAAELGITMPTVYVSMRRFEGLPRSRREEQVAS